MLGKSKHFHINVEAAVMTQLLKARHTSRESFIALSNVPTNGPPMAGKAPPHSTLKAAMLSPPNNTPYITKNIHRVGTHSQGKCPVKSTQLSESTRQSQGTRQKAVFRAKARHKAKGSPQS